MGLGFEYDMLVTTLTRLPLHLTFDDLRPRLLLHEQHLQFLDGDETGVTHPALAAQSMTSPQHARPNNAANCNNNNQQGGGRNNNHNRQNRGGGGNTQHNNRNRQYSFPAQSRHRWKMHSRYTCTRNGSLHYFTTESARVYFSEGRFIQEMEKGMKDYGTTDPEKAHVYFLPFRVAMMVQYLHVQGSRDIHPIGRTIADYVDTIIRKNGFWNRSSGADHFMLSCHDWVSHNLKEKIKKKDTGPWATMYVPQPYNNSIRVLCNTNTSEGFNPSRDVSFPEINLLTGEVTGSQLGGFSPFARHILAFFAAACTAYSSPTLEGRKRPIHSIIRPTPSRSVIQLNVEEDGYEVASPRVVEAIYSECVPVLISQGYVPPFSDVLNWKAFSVPVNVKDIPNIKSILMGISPRQYLRMHRR
ncbi:hypothetical protein Cgig2_008810 [Carnegiea gigantea]|uniref:Exostosin GT47 domain-containing protein n=1 Tax=Carnegiea gigantea TaxID=171969 RepID=A0A9Q1GXM6_9CARY|nr:hypothetical protein Cgig2_008810 [Carnegiea gigantea]